MRILRGMDWPHLKQPCLGEGQTCSTEGLMTQASSMRDRILSWGMGRGARLALHSIGGGGPEEKFGQA